MNDDTKIKKLELLLEYAIINIETTSLLFDKDDIWKKIDTLIRSEALSKIYKEITKKYLSFSAKMS